MSTTSRVGNPQANSIVLGVAENTARGLGFTIEPSALDFLMTKSVRKLDEISEAGDLDALRGKIEHNTAALVNYVVETKRDTPAPENLRGRSTINYAEMASAFSIFCKKFPDFIPFCAK
jgi:hypothetical protein